ncbi:hypothetical protein [Pseudooceanicola sp. 200-1SW]|uniref:hypothetical protein n=1 Tax=Pseudooceanicola sp. 200-1SW TaxID=3425949 RepID=UPI003D7F90BB
MPKYTAPGVYIAETRGLPPVVGSDSAVPLFIGPTERATDAQGHDLTGRVQPVSSPAEFAALFGDPPRHEIRTRADGQGLEVGAPFLLPRAVALFFETGGAKAYVLSTGPFTRAGKGLRPEAEPLIAALESAEARAEGPDLLVLPDAGRLPPDQALRVWRAALAHCAAQGDRIALIDPPEAGGSAELEAFRQALDIPEAAFGLAYAPWLISPLPRFDCRDLSAALRRDLSAQILAEPDPGKIHGAAKELGQEPLAPYVDPAWIHQVLQQGSATYRATADAAQSLVAPVPPSGVIAGMIAAADARWGMWKAPVRTVPQAVQGLASDPPAASLAAPGASVAINPLRLDPSQGILIDGARMMAPDSGDLRYLPVRRTQLYITRTLRAALRGYALSSPGTGDDPALWQAVKTEVEAFLASLWRDGAFPAASADEAFSVAVGPGLSMTQAVRDAGILRLSVGIALVRPASFIPVEVEARRPAAP